MRNKILPVFFVGVLAGVIFGGASMAGIEARTSHSAPQAKARPIRTVYVSRTVYKRADDVNTMFYKAGQYCKGDGGVGTILLFPQQPANFEALCAWGHSAYTSAGLRL